jgi:hypothetical protein
MSVVEFQVGDVVELRKAHPCGGAQWSVVRLGADIGLRCDTCARRLVLPRRSLERRLKRFVRRAPAGPAWTGEHRGG